MKTNFINSSFEMKEVDFNSLEELVTKQLKSKGVVLHVGEGRIYAQHLEVHYHYSEEFLHHLMLQEEADIVSELCPVGLRLYAIIGSGAMVKTIFRLFSTVKDPEGLARLAVHMVQHGVLTREQAVTQELITVLLDGCDCFKEAAKGFTVDNVRRHIRHMLDMLSVKAEEKSK